MSETRILKMRGGGIIKYLKNESILKCHTRNMKSLVQEKRGGAIIYLLKILGKIRG